MAVAHYILFSIVATVFGGMFLLIGVCFLYVCFLTVRGYPGADDSEVTSSVGTVSFIQPRATLRHFLVLNPTGNPLFGYRLSDIKSTCASFRSSFKSSLRGSHRRRRTDLEQGEGGVGEVVNPLVEVASQSSKELRLEEVPAPVRPVLADMREWRTM
ncbi:hypothetical protein BSKO_07689 [Bryopsis sp. KO-2023]|nr:hypothetical protein BSKO_07689 [Bryopsis sp. KO-2023]